MTVTNKLFLSCIFSSFALGFVAQAGHSTDAIIRAANRDSSNHSCDQIFMFSSIEPVDRFSIRFSALKTGLTSELSTQDIINEMASEGFRQSMIQLQALAKVYEEAFLDSKDFERVRALRKAIKMAEGSLGDVMRTQDLLVRTKDSHLLSSDIKLKINQDLESQRDVLVKSLQEQGWLPNPSIKIDSLVEITHQMVFKNNKKDQRAVIKAMVELVESTRTHLKDLDLYFKKKKFSEEDLDLGLHTLRRELRWITTAIQSVDGVFKYENVVGDDLEFINLEKAVGNSKYVKLSLPKMDAAILNQKIIFQIANLVTELGKLKDFKETQLDLANFLIVNKIIQNKDEAEKLANNVMIEYFGKIDVEQSGRDLYRYYLEKDPLKLLKKNLELDLELVEKDKSK